MLDGFDEYGVPADADNFISNLIKGKYKKNHLYVMWHFLFGILDYSKESTVSLFKLLLDAESQHRAASTEVL